MNLVNLATLAVAVTSMWILRRAWRTPWERPALVNVGLQTFDVVLSLRLVNRRASSVLHTVTGVWNCEELIGHCCYIVGMFSLLYLVASRLDMTPSQFRRFARFRIELPATFTVALMVAIFVPNKGHLYVPDTIAEAASKWMHAYWTLMCWTVMFILVQVFNGLRVLRREPHNRKTANAYTMACSVSVVCCLAFVFQLEHLQWLLVRGEVIAYSIAAAYGWRIKVRDLQRA